MQVTVENGECNSITETITVFVPLLDNAVGGGSITPAAINVCAGERLNQDLISTTDASLAANSSAASVTYQWQRWTGTQWQNLIGAGTNSSSLLSSTLVTFTASDTQLRRVAYATRNGQSCDEKYAFVNINISAVGTPVIMSPTGVFDFCEGDNITFSANGDLNADDDFFWKIGTTTATGDTFALEMTPAISGQSLELYLVTSAGCTSTLVNKIISVTQSLTFGLDTDKPGDTVCAGDDIQIQVTLGPGIVGTTTYTYDLGAGGVVVSNTPTITASFNQETDVQVTVENGECNSITETITVFVQLLDNTVGGGSINPATITVCAGERLDQYLISNTDATLAANSSAASVTYQWQRWTGTQWQNLIGAGTNSSS